MHAHSSNLPDETVPEGDAGTSVGSDPTDRLASVETLGNLAAGIAHAFSNALTAIGGSADLLRSRIHDAAALEDVERIRATVAHASGITRQLLRLADRQVVRPEIIDLGEHVGLVTRWLGPLLGENLRLVTEIDAGAGQVRADPDEIAELILVLATNARDAMRGEGTLRLSVGRLEAAADGAGPGGVTESDGTWADEPLRRLIGDAVPAGSWVILEVADTGDGMTAEAQRNLFRPFFTTKRGRGAAGLGLASMHAAVRRAGGAVTVTTGPSRGTAVRIHLPAVISAQPGRTGTPVSAPSVAGRGLSALLVEDDPDVRGFAASALRRLGFDVLTAANPEEAIGRAAAHPDPIALLVADVVMPDMTGPALAEQLAAVRRDLAVLFMSGHSLEASPQLLELPPGSQFLQKPFGAGDLATAVAAAMGPAPAGGAPRGRLTRGPRLF